MCTLFCVFFSLFFVRPSRSGATVNLKPFAFLPPSCHSVRWAWPAPPPAGGAADRTVCSAACCRLCFRCVVALWNSVTEFLASPRPPVGSTGSRRLGSAQLGSARPGSPLLIPHTLSCWANRRLSAAPGLRRQRSSMCLANS